MSNKYEFTGKTKTVCGVELKQIRAIVSFGSITKGEIGGWISEEGNLSQNGNAWVSGDAHVYGNSQVSDNSQVSGDAHVFDDARVSGDALVFGDARVSGDADFMLVGYLGSRRAFLTIHADAKIGIRWTTGCFSGTEDQFKEAIQKTHGDNEYAKQYLAAIDFASSIVKAKSVSMDVVNQVASN
jgi:hypothetical protein